MLSLSTSSKRSNAKKPSFLKYSHETHAQHYDGFSSLS